MKTAPVAVLLLTAACAHPARQARDATPGRPVLVVQTYNLNFGLAGEPRTLAAIGEAGADLVLLQETTPEWERFIRATYAGVYPHMAFHACCGAGGLGVLSRRPFTVKEILEGPPGSWFPAMRLVAQTSVGPVQLLNVHLRPPASESGSFVKGYFTTGPVREAQLRRYLAALEPGLPVLVAGDFNESDGGAVRLLRAEGLTSVLPEFSPSAKTWHWPLPVGSLSSRLDHVAYDAHLVPLDARVLRRGESDHWPVVARFQRR